MVELVLSMPSNKHTFTPLLIDEKTSITSLYQNHQTWLINWLSKQLGCRQQAKDLSQDTFVKVIVKQRDIASVKEPRSWLLTIAKHILIDRRRRFLLEQAYIDELKLSAEGAGIVPSEEEVYLAVNALEMIAKALEPLPKNVKQAFILRHIDGMTQSAIAERLSVSATMVQKYLVQSLVACQQVLKPQALIDD